MFSTFASAQDDYGLIYNCPPSDTVGCFADVPEPDPGAVIVTGSCAPQGDDHAEGSGGGAAGGGDPGDQPTTGDDGGSDGEEAVACEAVTNGCFSASLIARALDEEAATVTYTIQVDYLEGEGCRHAISNIAFGLPEDIIVSGFKGTDSYRGNLGGYIVENGTANPFHSIKFETNHDNYEPGTSEQFQIELPADAAFPDDVIDIRVKASTESTDLALDVDCGEPGEGEPGDGGEEEPADDGEPDGGEPGTADYEVAWEYDYVVPGGSGCVESPVVIIRSYSVTAECVSSAYCEQLIVVAGECADGRPSACDEVNAGLISEPVAGVAFVADATVEHDGITFPSVEQGRKGHYEVWRPEQRGQVGGRSPEGDIIVSGLLEGDIIVSGRGNTQGMARGEMLGRIAARGAEKYDFAHESIQSDERVDVYFVTAEVGVSSSAWTPDLEGVHNFTVYPNPGDISIGIHASTLGETQPALVEVYDATGSRVGGATVPAVGAYYELELDAESLAPGMYFLVMRTANGAVRKSRWSKY